MNATVRHLLRQSVALAAALTLLAGCADEAPLAPDRQPERSAQFARQPSAEQAEVIATLRRATARYHDLDAAIDDGFILVHPCEERPGEGPVGDLYADLDRVGDGLIDPERPDGLIYEPGEDGHPKPVGVELAIPYALWTEPEPPEFLGHAFQREDEFQVFGLHVWTWQHNPEGMFALSNPSVSC